MATPNLAVATCRLLASNQALLIIDCLKFLISHEPPYATYH
jgi:hypothetical protein